MLETNYILKREDNREARFYWMRYGKYKNLIKKYIGITSLSSKCIPADENLIKWQILKDPDGRLLELSAEHGTLEHLVIDHYDRGEGWRKLIPNDYKHERMVLGSLIAWKKFCEDYRVEIIASELMLKWESGRKRFACTLDKVAWIYLKRKVKKQIEDGVYQRGEKKGEIKYKEITEIVEDKVLAIIDLKSNFFEKDTKSFYESHLFQLWGQRLAFQQSFPDMPLPRIFNWSPNNWRTRTNGNMENLYTLYEWNQDYRIDFNDYMKKAYRKGWLIPNGKIEVFTDFTKDTPIEEAYKVMSYDEYINFKEEEERKKAEQENLELTKGLEVKSEAVDKFIRKDEAA